MKDTVLQLRGESMALLNSMKDWREDVAYGFAKSKPEIPTSYLQAEAHVQEAFFWLGKCLASLGQPNPYPQSSNPGNPVIEPPADAHSRHANLEDVSDFTALIKSMRKCIETMLVPADSLLDMKASDVRWNLAVRQVYVRLHDAKHRLGFCLGQFRELVEQVEQMNTKLSVKPAESVPSNGPGIDVATGAGPILGNDEKSDVDNGTLTPSESLSPETGINESGEAVNTESAS